MKLEVAKKYKSPFNQLSTLYTVNNKINSVRKLAASCLKHSIPESVATRLHSTIAECLGYIREEIRD